MAIPAPELGPRWKNQPLVRPVDAPKTRRLWIFLLAAGLALAPYVVYLVQIQHYVQLGYETQQVRSNQEKLLEAERRLRIERAYLQSLPEVERRAAGDLGLVHPPAGDVVVVKGSGPAPRPSRAPDRQVGAR